MPPAALANDMMIYYAPSDIFSEKKVTVMEMICSSVCITSMLCFTLEKRYRKERPIDMEVAGNARRMAARGNATSFPLPWQDLLAQLALHDDQTEANTSVQQKVRLPRVGDELAEIVSVLLKTAGDDEDDSDFSLL